MNDPEKYEANIQTPTRVNNEFIPKLISHMSWGNYSDRHGRNVLDYGCGPGSTGYNYFLPLILQQSDEYPESQLYSVDVSSKMVDFARSHFPHDRITYAVGNITEEEEFPFRDIKFSKIFAINVFHFVKEIKKTLEGLKDILELGGQLGLANGTISSWAHQSWRILGESASWKEYMHGYQNFMPEWTAYEGGEPEAHLRKVLEEEGSGLHVEYLEFAKRNFVFENISDCIDFTVSTNPCLDAIPEELLPRFKADTRRILTTIAGVPLDSPDIVLPYEYLVAVLERK